VGLAEDGCAGGVALVEAPRDQPRDLDVRQLVLADRHHVAVAEQDVGGLMDRVREQQGAHAAAAVGGRLRLDGGVALELRDADEAEKGKQELVERRHRAVGEDRGRGRVDAGGQIVQDQPENRWVERPDAFAVRDDLVVGDDEEDLDAGALQAHAVGERAEIVAQVQRAGGTVAGQDPEALRVAGDLLLQQRWT
jgi:hypothetical protein